MPVSGGTRAFGAGPFGFATFGTWRIRRTGARVLGAAAGIGGGVATRAAGGRAIADAIAAGGARNQKVSNGAVLAGAAVLGGSVRERHPGASAIAFGDLIGGGQALRGGFGQAVPRSALRGRLRQLWDRPDEIPETPSWGPATAAGSGPWQPTPMPAAPSWAPQQPAEH